MSTPGTGATETAPPVEPAVTEQPAAPVVETAPSTTSTPESEVKLTEGTGKMAARTRTAERIRAREERQQKEVEVAEAARQRALGQPRVEAGKPEGGEFKKEDAAAADAAPAEGATPAGTASAAPAPTTDPVATAPAGMVDVPLPDGHPLRARGRTYIRVAQEFEADVRNGINSTMRLQTVESERDALARDNALLEARRQALAGNLPNPETDPHLRALIEQVKAAPEGWMGKTGAEVAAMLTEAFKAQQELALIRAEGRAHVEHEEARTAGQVFADIQAQAGQVLGIWAQSGELQGRIPQLVKQYYAAVDQRNTRDNVNQPPTVAEFFEWVKPAYRLDPRVQAAITALRQQDQERDRERIRLEVKAEFEKKQAEAAAAAVTRRAGLPPTSRALPQQSTTPAPAPTPSAPPQPGSHRRNARQGAAERAMKYARPQ